MKFYYYFCRNCGGDTATYDFISSCPYCYAHKPAFTLIEELDGSAGNSQTMEKIEMLRSRWISEHPNQPIGVRGSARKRLFGRRKSRH